MRIFIAAALDNESLNYITKLQDKLITMGVTAKKTGKENLHLTLFFLGELEVSCVQELIGEFKKLPPLKLELTSEKVDTFYNGTIILKYKESKSLIEYRDKLKNMLDNMHINYDRKKFVPHITLFRKSPNKILDNIINRSIIIGVHIYSSLLTSNGPIYDILA